MTIYVVTRYNEIEDSISVSKSISAFKNKEHATKLCDYLNGKEDINSKQSYGVVEVEFFDNTDLILPAKE